MIKLKAKPIYDRIIVKADSPEKVTASGIIIPDSVKDKPMTGVVLKAGPGTKENPTVVKSGDKILYGKQSTEIQIEKEQVLLMLESNIYAVL